MIVRHETEDGDVFFVEEDRERDLPEDGVEAL